MPMLLDEKNVQIIAKHGVTQQNAGESKRLNQKSSENYYVQNRILEKKAIYRERTLLGHLHSQAHMYNVKQSKYFKKSLKFFKI